MGTDDTIFFHRNKGVGQNRLGAFDKSMAEAGVDRNLQKDVTLVQQMTALGFDIDSFLGLVEQ